MHGLAVQLTPVIAAKSKAPFYVAGGALVLWALILALGLGLRKPKFPGSLRGERIVIAITAVLVVAALATAVLTSGPEKPEAATAATGTTPQVTSPTTATPVPAAPTTTAAKPAPPATTTAAKPAAPATTTAAKPAAPAPAATQLALAANPSGLLSYNTKQLSAKAGKVTISFTNSSPVEHNVTIMSGTKVVGATPTFVGGSKTLTLTLEPGTYQFYCSVPGHRQAGMEGTLKVS
jgi:plastocyanin